MRFTELSKLSQDTGLSLLADWRRAALSSNQAEPFCCSPAWQLSFHEAFAPDRCIFVQSCANSVLAFAEMAPSPDRVILTPVEASWLFGNPLLGKDAVNMLDEAMGYFARIYAPHFPRIVISGIRPDGVLAGRLFRTFGSRFAFYLYGESVQCSASLAGGVDGFLSRRSANHRHKLAKASRRAGELGLSFERLAPSSAKEASAVYERMIAVELASWKGIGRCGMAESPAREFYDAMLQRLAETRESRIIFARHENRDIGFIFGGMAGNIYRGQQFSYDEAWKIFSIGNLMQLETIAWLCEDGVKRYDMGPLSGSRMEYKAHWTERTATIQTWILERK